MANIVIIGGQAASGRTTAAKSVAMRLGAVHVDLGMLCRAAALHMDATGQCPEPGRLVPLWDASGHMRVVLDGTDATERLDDPALSVRAAELAAPTAPGPWLWTVLDPLLSRILASGRKAVIDGDLPSGHVLPCGAVEFRLFADRLARVRRRVAAYPGIDEAAALADLAAMDGAMAFRSSNVTPGHVPVVEIDATSMSPKAVVSEILRLLRGDAETMPEIPEPDRCASVVDDWLLRMFMHVQALQYRLTFGRPISAMSDGEKAAVVRAMRPFLGVDPADATESDVRRAERLSRNAVYAALHETRKKEKT